MILPLRQAFHKNSSFRQLFTLHPFIAKGSFLTAILILCVRWSLRHQLYCVKAKRTGKFSDVVVGVLTTQEYFNPRFGYQLSTFLSDILDKGGNLVVSLESGVIPFSNFTQQARFQNRRSEQFTLFESKCPVGYSQLICRTIELLTIMVEAHPGASWYIRIDDDTLLIPEALHNLLRQLNPQDSLGLGSPSFYFCLSPLRCTHKRYPGLPWKDIDQVVRLIRGGAGYVLSSSVILWIISNNDQISTTAQQLRSYAEDLTIFYSLQKHMKGFEIIQARSFFFERPEVALRFSPFHGKSDVEAPVSFHMNHNLVNGHSLYEGLNELHRTEKSLAMVDGMGVLKGDASSQVLDKIRSQVAMKMMTCVRGVTEIKIQSRNWDSQLRDRLIDMVLVLLVIRFGEARDFEFFSETLIEVVGVMRILCLPGTKNKNDENLVLRTRTFPARLISLSHNMDSRESHDVREVNAVKSREIRMLLNSGEQHLRRVRMSFASTIDLLVDCEKVEKRVRHKINSHQQRKKTLLGWSALQAVRGYARSRLPDDGYFWQMRYLQYISYMRDSWEFDKDECTRTLDCQEDMAAELLDLVLYLRRGRVVLTERREHHLALVALQIGHVYIHDEGDVKSKTKSLCAGDLPFVKCVSNLADATEALVELLLGEAFFNRTWRLPALITAHQD